MELEEMPDPANETEPVEAEVLRAMVQRLLQVLEDYDFLSHTTWLKRREAAMNEALAIPGIEPPIPF